jgi:hypothetical protein
MIGWGRIVGSGWKLGQGEREVVWVVVDFALHIASSFISLC